MTALKTQAINVALTGNWVEAARLNIEILRENEKDTEALNRLAFALSAMGNSKEARESYERVLDIDPLNPIAKRGLKRLENGNHHNPAVPTQLMSTMFLEESGKTRITTLLNTAPIKVLCSLQIGQNLTMCKKRMKIFIQDENKQYIGVLPDDLGKRLIKFIDGGNMYAVYVKSANDHGVTIFMKELFRAKRFKDQPSFLFGDKTHLAFTKTKKNHNEEESE